VVAGVQRVLVPFTDKICGGLNHLSLRCLLCGGNEQQMFPREKWLRNYETILGEHLQVRVCSEK
jgi:hypothetical protein